NASKYTPAGTRIEVGSTVGDGVAMLWVRDHGPGIPPQFRDRIFQRFDRAQWTRSVGGSGLGLAIVETIAKAQGGRCDVTDTPGGGVTFTIRGPVATPEVRMPAGGTRAQTPMRRREVAR